MQIKFNYSLLSVFSVHRFTPYRTHQYDKIHGLFKEKKYPISRSIMYYWNIKIPLPGKHSINIKIFVTWNMFNLTEIFVTAIMAATFHATVCYRSPNDGERSVVWAVLAVNKIHAGCNDIALLL